MKRFFLLFLCTAALSFAACTETSNTQSASELTSREEVDANPRIVVPSMTAYTGDIFTNEAPAAPAGGSFCPNCGNAVTAGQRFCSNCGNPLAKSCPGCGAPVEPNARFCAQCGTKL